MCVVYDCAELFAGPQLLRMVHTREGAEVSCRAIAAGTAKDRKKIVKAVKSHVHRLVTDE